MAFLHTHGKLARGLRRWRRRHASMREKIKSRLKSIRGSPSKKSSADQCAKLYLRAHRYLDDCVSAVKGLDVRSWRSGKEGYESRKRASAVLERAHAAVKEVCEMHRRLSVKMILVVGEKAMLSFDRPLAEGAHWERGFTRIRYLLAQVDRH